MKTCCTELNEAEIFEDFQPQAPEECEKKKVHVPALILSIIGALSSVFLPPITLICSTISLLLSIMNSKSHKTKAILIVDIIALVVAVVTAIADIVYIIKKRKQI